MWSLKFQDNPKIFREEEFQYQWDLVPQEKPVEEIRFRILGKKYSISGFDSCSIHRRGVHPFGSHPRFLGYVFYVIRGNVVEEIAATIQPVDKLKWPLGISNKYYDIEELNRIGARKEQFRNGIGVT
jgi:hypothetical protein